MLHTEQPYRARKRLSEEYMGELNRLILDRLNPSRKVNADAMVCANPGETAHGLQPAEMVEGIHKDTRIIQPRNRNHRSIRSNRSC